MNWNGSGILALVVFLSFAAVVAPGAAQEPTFKGKFRVIEITPFAITDGVELPANVLGLLTEEVVSQLVESKKFTSVIRSGEALEPAAGPVVRLVGTVTEFSKGNRAARYFVGFGAGRAKIKALVKFTDASTNEILLEDDVDGNVVMGTLGGESSGAMRGLAKEVAKVVKKVF